MLSMGFLCYNLGSKETMMDTIATVVKYIFVIAAGVEIALILRALVALARGKARAAGSAARIAEE
jgi:hypothetical protein